MQFNVVLDDLMAQNEGAVGVLFLDDSGETVDLACAESNLFQLKVVGAYVGIYLRQAREYLTEAGLGEPEWLHIERDAHHLFVQPLPDGYYLVLVQRAPSMVARARASLAVAAELLSRELFASG